MKTYEIVTIFSLQMTGEIPEQGKALMEGVLQKHEGKVLNVIDLGKRTLGYTVKKAKEGYCLIIESEINPARVDALRQALQLVPEILKFTVVIKTTPKVKPRRVKRKQRQRSVAQAASPSAKA